MELWVRSGELWNFQLGKVNFGIFELGQVSFGFLATVLCMSMCQRNSRRFFFLRLPFWNSWQKFREKAIFSHLNSLQWSSSRSSWMVKFKFRTNLTFFACFLITELELDISQNRTNIWIFAPKIEFLLIWNNLNFRAKNWISSLKYFEFSRQKYNFSWLENIWIFALKIEFLLWNNLNFRAKNWIYSNLKSFEFSRQKSNLF